MKTTKLCRITVTILMMVLFMNMMYAQTFVPSDKKNSKKNRSKIVFLNTQKHNDKYPIVKDIQKFMNEDCSFFEVTEDMFELLAQNVENDPEMKKNLAEMKHLAHLNCLALSATDQTLIEKFENEAKLVDFKLLMRTHATNEKSVFYKKTNGDVNEYLLVKHNGIHYLATTLDITSIRQLTDLIYKTGRLGR